MDEQIIQHESRHFNYTLSRRLEIEHEICHCPVDQPGLVAKCPECGFVMAYRGLGRLRSGTRVHVFECIHSHREVHSVSIVIGE